MFRELNNRRLSNCCVICFRIWPKPDVRIAVRYCVPFSSIEAAIPNPGGWPHDAVNVHIFNRWGFIGHRCAQIKEKTPAFRKFTGIYVIFSSRIDRHGQEVAGATLNKRISERFGPFRKIHIMESRSTHRPTNRMILTSLNSVPN